MLYPLSYEGGVVSLPDCFDDVSEEKGLTI